MYVYKLMTRSYRLCYKVTSLSKCILIYWQGLHSGKSPSSNCNEIIGIVRKVLGSGGGLQKNLGHIERTSGSLELSAPNSNEIIGIVGKVLGSGGGLQKNLGHIERTSRSLKLSASNSNEIIGIVGKVLGSGGGLQKNLGHIERTSRSL